MLGFKRSENALMVGAHVSEGDRLQLRVRDAASANQELRELADRLARSPATASPAGVLMFACLGRGQRFFGLPDHDVSVVRRRLNAPPLGGFFCNGELGPVRGRTWLHGYTSSFGLFSPRGWS
jgi:small ligand-binding sensory domain FIST